MNLRNYTSSVAVQHTIANIESFLTVCGVDGIMKTYGADKQPNSLVFRITLGERRYSVKLPANVQGVKDWLWNEYVKSTTRPRKTKEDFAEQAARTAWRIQEDWVRVQMSLIQLKQADMLQVFMAYLWDGTETYYDRIKGSGYKALPQVTGE